MKTPAHNRSKKIQSLFILHQTMLSNRADETLLKPDLKKNFIAPKKLLCQNACDLNSEENDEQKGCAPH